MRFSEITEKAPPGKKAARFISKAKKDFKSRYGDAWKQVLYSTAWKMFGESLSEALLEEESGPGEKLTRTDQTALYEVWRNSMVALVGGMRCGSSPPGLLRCRYVVIDLKAMEGGTSQEDATVGSVDIFTNGNEFRGLVNIKLNKNNRRAGIGATIVKSLVLTCSEDFLIYDIKKVALGFWKKMGAEIVFSDFKKPIPNPREYKGTMMGIIRKNNS